MSNEIYFIFMKYIKCPLHYISLQAIKTRLAEVLESENAILAAVTLPRFKVRWMQSQDRKDKAKASLLAECRRNAQDEDQQTRTTSKQG